MGRESGEAGLGEEVRHRLRRSAVSCGRRERSEDRKSTIYGKQS